VFHLSKCNPNATIWIPRNVVSPYCRIMNGNNETRVQRPYIYIYIYRLRRAFVCTSKQNGLNLYFSHSLHTRTLFAQCYYYNNVTRTRVSTYMTYVYIRVSNDEPVVSIVVSRYGTRPGAESFHSNRQQTYGRRAKDV